ncbi:hypothetical protein PtrSN002B_001476 [Pyrenophora tritici-repentis]|uniref:Uncharacterized protein n=2 Tax=Pyrenophora tritici-repentis TaxID=45151 RepID=A0A2W1GKF7_9PLEO|nr:uncharacterized protein PTRG_02134 [Pyrenophora tritici-repentis Pt-1C-BFP]KAF7455297.1 hypothetical protein A1F99_025550 [Pyrenophora tritici-repentis]EDU41572.1 predicted protein [Pyrenophora tritici-repentis Pt-1C-BFP]KAF7578478.1 hypothetical protein PtrM4_027180 [Pyrenophora tritici-repentis]KAG9389045.1 hypothetical protein A1F94_001938 [Pyrenophora tritici-repentis]KAI0570730.1 hypothetical protein Alg130_11125 [Pyrenophora tritici-repentis]
MDVEMSGDPQKQTSDQGGFDNNSHPPYNCQQHEPYSAHHVSQPTDFLKVMRKAGIHDRHKLCLHCGKIASQDHRMSWRQCPNYCAFDGRHEHPGKLCPHLLEVANKEWCFSRTDEYMIEDLKAARLTRKQTDMSTSDHMKASLPPHQLFNRDPISFGNSFGGMQYPGYNAGVDYSNYGAGYTNGYSVPPPDAGYSTSTAPGSYTVYDAAFAQPNNFRGYIDPGHPRVDNPPYTGLLRPRDSRERSPTMQASSGNYRDRTPWAHNKPNSSSERGRFSLQETPGKPPSAAQYATLGMQSVVDQERSASAPHVKPQTDTKTARVFAASRTRVEQLEQQRQAQAAELAELRGQLDISHLRYRTVATAFVRHMMATQQLMGNMQSLLVLPPSLYASDVAVPSGHDQAEGPSQAHKDAGDSFKEEQE